MLFQNPAGVHKGRADRDSSGGGTMHHKVNRDRTIFVFAKLHLITAFLFSICCIVRILINKFIYVPEDCFHMDFERGKR